MKKHFFYGGLILSTLLFSEACKNKANATDGNTQELPVTATSDVVQSAPANPDAPVMTFDKVQYDYGTIKEKDIVKHTFTFTNTGKSPLTIEHASGSCGCTVPIWPKNPIKPGEKGDIKVEFNSAGKAGQQTKTVTIIANTQPRETVLTLSGTVQADSSAAAH